MHKLVATKNIESIRRYGQQYRHNGTAQSHCSIKPGLHELQLQVKWERHVSLFSCSRATLLTWSAQRRRSTTIESNVSLLSTGS